MNDRKLLITLCLNFGLVVSRGLDRPCERTLGGLCGRGQYLDFVEGFQQKCVDCPKDTFMDFHSHICEICKKHTQPNPMEVVIMEGSSTTDSAIVCKEGFFRAKTLTAVGRGDCQMCSICGDDVWTARECGPEEDTLCCSNEMVVTHAEEDGHLVCVYQDAIVLRQIQVERKRRFSGNSNSGTRDGNGGNNSNNGTDSKSMLEVSQGNTQSSADHGYSRADYETETKQNKVDFPVWARVLCAGVAIGVFLFYLGVGIPCNACGSRDMLRALRNRLIRQHEPATTEEDTKEKSTEKPKSTSEQV